MKAIKTKDGFKLTIKKDGEYSTIQIKDLHLNEDVALLGLTIKELKGLIETLVKCLPTIKDNHKCEYCGIKSPDVEYVADPYILEIYGEEDMHWLCNECFKELAEDI